MTGRTGVANSRCQRDRLQLPRERVALFTGNVGCGFELAFVRIVKCGRRLSSIVERYAISTRRHGARRSGQERIGRLHGTRKVGRVEVLKWSSRLEPTSSSFASRRLPSADVTRRQQLPALEPALAPFGLGFRPLNALKRMHLQPGSVPLCSELLGNSPISWLHLHDAVRPHPDTAHRRHTHRCHQSKPSPAPAAATRQPSWTEATCPPCCCCPTRHRR